MFDIFAASGKLPYRLTNDLLFHIVMSRSPASLKSLLAAILSLDPEEITAVQILNPIDYHEAVRSSKIILDIFLELNHNSFIDIEMQVQQRDDWNNRALFYSGRMIANQNPGKYYHNIKAVHQIGILNFRQGNDHGFYRRYRLTNDDGELFTERFQIHTLNLKNIKNADEEDHRYKRVLWGRMLTAETWEEIQELARLDDVFREAGEIMGEAMSIEDYILFRREDAEMDYERGLNAARETAMRKGLEEGREKGLLEGREKGLLEGREKGLLEGREKGLLEGREKGLEEGRTEGEIKGEHNKGLKVYTNMLARGYSRAEAIAVAEISEADADLLDKGKM